ncbi:hypothetical protein HMPREF4655_20599 [Helicobacter pylori 35A]|nr:hypothetical protein HMPREF4655_20599 [Helicobacter pylori 35A]
MLKINGSKKKFFTSFWNGSILKWTLIIKWIIIKKLDFNGAIKTLRKIEVKPTLFNHYRNGNSVSNLNGNNPTTNEFKTQEPQRTKQ